MIPLNEKELPSCELSPLALKNFGPLSVELCDRPIKEAALPLLLKLQMLEANPNFDIWNPDQQEGNIRFHRPFHDDLGINQIIFSFCDDLFYGCYRLPWWNTWKPELEPIFSVLNIDSNKVVRCLLARMPIGKIIPMHHDTGLWATKTHRVHVPLVTSNQSGDEAKEVVFKSGLVDDETQMIRQNFSEFHAIELNNRAKHYVVNNWDTPRIHLIFDYVDDDTFQNDDLAKQLKFVNLTGNEIIEQTRRRIFVRKPNEPVKYKTNSNPKSTALHSAEKKRCFSVLLNLINYANGTLNSNECNDSQAIVALTKSSMRYVYGELRAENYLDSLIKVMKNDSICLALAIEYLFPVLLSDSERYDTLKEEYDSSSFGKLNSLIWRNHPRFLVLGAMKCGTTALYEYMCQHPKIIQPKVKESHFFDWRWGEMNAVKLNVSQQHRCKLLAAMNSVSANQHGVKIHEEKIDIQMDDLSLENNNSLLLWTYMMLFDNAPSSKDIFSDAVISGEATPSYLLGGITLAKRVLSTCGPNVKFIIVLRDPVARAWSHFNMTSDNLGTADQLRRRGDITGKSFVDLINEDLNLLKELEIKPDMDLQMFNEKYVGKFLSGNEPKNGSYAYVGRGLYSLQIKCWLSVFPRKSFKFILSEDLKKADSKLPEHQEQFHHLMDEVFDFIEVQHTEKSIHFIKDKELKNSRKYDDIDPVIDKELREYYKPHVEDLELLLSLDLTSWKPKP